MNFFANANDYVNFMTLARPRSAGLAIGRCFTGHCGLSTSTLHQYAWIKSIRFLAQGLVALV